MDFLMRNMWYKILVYSSFLNEVKLCLPLEGREVLLYFGGCQTPHGPTQPSLHSYFLLFVFATLINNGYSL